MKPLRKTSSLALGALLVSLATPAAAQQLFASARFAASGGTITHTTSGGTASASGNSAEATARAMAQFGVLRTYAEAATDGTPGESLGHSTARFTDRLTLDSPGRTGQRGYLDVNWRVDGELTATGAQDQIAYAHARTRLFAENGGAEGSETFFEGQETDDGHVAGSNGFFLNQDKTLRISFVYGTAFDFTWEVYSAAQFTYSNRTGYAESDLEHTAVWGGFASVMDGAGNAVTNYSLTSASGTNWSEAITPVPEPASLAALGFGALALLRRRRRA